MSDAANMNRAATRIAKYKTAIWGELTAMANRLGATNLGQGFPSWEAEKFVKDAGMQAIAANLNQYTRSAGHMRLVQAVGTMYSSIFERTIDPLTEVLITNGATQALSDACRAYINPGDECIVFDPAYDSYVPQIELAGGLPVHVPLRKSGNSGSSSDYGIDFAELAAAITPRTKMVFINNPHNPSGKLFSREELQKLADLCIKHDLICLSDEVYEFMVFDKQKIVRIATLPGMWDRTITLGSAGKTYSVTGWKVGWTVGPPQLIRPMFLSHQYSCYSVNTPLQEAVAVAIEKSKEEGYFERFSQQLEVKRDRLCKILQNVGLEPTVPEGAYFVLADTSKIDFPLRDGLSRDFSFCYWLMEEIGVAAIPPSIFYAPEHAHLADNLVRFCFCKHDALLDSAEERLQKLKQFIKQ
jgi:aspartate/methionine/tyrosine aminotransferase